MVRKCFFLFCMVLAAIAFQGCTGRPIPVFMPVKQPEILRLLNQNLEKLYPEKFNALHRVILTLADKNYVLEGYLSVNRPDRHLCLIAQNSLGGKLFDIDYIEDVKNEIQINLDVFKKKWLEKSVLKDLKLIYLLRPMASAGLFSDDQGRFILSGKNNMGLNELVFEPAQAGDRFRLVEIRRFNHQRKPVCTIVLSYGKNIEEKYPRVIEVEDLKMKYRLKIKVAYFI